MNKIVVIKYGELTTKKGNRKLFIDTLSRNVKWKLEGVECSVLSTRDRMYISSNDLDIVIEKLKYIFGIHAMFIAEKVDSDYESIKNRTIELIKNKEFKTFKVDTKRSDKKFPIPSMEVSRRLGGDILENIPNIKVDVHNPELLIRVEIRRDSSYVYFDEIKGLGGYPVGVQGRGMLMLSGGIDSPVAGYLAMKRGININCVYFDSPPHTSIDAKNKVIELARKLNEYSGSVKLYVVPFTKIQEEIYKEVPHSYMITIMRRMMYRIAERLNKLIIINGENIGQVASQTLDSINVINKVVSTPILRPVSCFDKIEIIEIAKKIGTYETSILPFEDCCTIFLPKNPVIYPKLELCEKYEDNFDYETLIDTCMENIVKEDLKINVYEDLF